MTRKTQIRWLRNIGAICGIRGEKTATNDTKDRIRWLHNIGAICGIRGDILLLRRPWF